MKYFSFAHQITVYWLYDQYVENGEYTFYLDDKECGKSNKTHFTFDGLDADKEYEISVYNHGVLFDKRKIKTQKEKEIINVMELDPSIDNEGETLVTKKIQAVLDKANKDNVIYFPKGEYLCGALFVKSNTEIYLEEDANIKGSIDPSDYLPMIASRFEGIELDCYASLINIGKMNHEDGYTTSNVIIRGKGSIIGGGRELCENIIAKELPLRGDRLNAGRRRNRLINISNSENIIIEGLYLGYSSSWNIHMIYSSNVITTNCKIESKHYHNGDGWDPDSSSNCTLFNCEFDVGDDLVAIKSGKNPEGNIVNIPCHDINVFDCHSTHSHGIAVGSEMSGGIYNVFVYDCDLTNSMLGLHIKATRKRGGYVRNVVFNNCKAPLICVEGNVTYNDDGEGANMPYFKDFKFINSTLSGISQDCLDNIKIKPHISIIGYQEDESKVSNIELRNITLLENNNDQKIVVEHCQNVIRS